MELQDMAVCELDKCERGIPVEPYYDRGGIVIYNADCRQVLPFLGKSDLLLTDPPYGIGESNNDNGSRSCLARSKDYGKSDWDNKRVVEFLPDVFRLSKNQVIFGG